MKHATIGLAILLSACASGPTVVELIDGGFMVSKRAMTGSSGAGTLRAEALQEASNECRKAGKVAQIQSEKERNPWYVPGNYHTLEITFRCLAGPVN